MTKEIELTQGQVALVDDKDHEWLKQWDWFAHCMRGSHYAARNITVAKRKRREIYMHREILGLKFKDGNYADHIDRDTLNNKRSNLRVVDNASNSRNHGGYSNNKSGHNGVIWHTVHKMWHSYIRVDYKLVYLGLFNNIDNAVEARRLGEIKYWGAER